MGIYKAISTIIKNTKRQLTSQDKRGENAFDVLCNKDLFLLIQEFTLGMEKIVIKYCTKFSPRTLKFTIFENALNERYWNIADRIYRHAMAKSEAYSLFYWPRQDISLWPSQIWNRSMVYPHQCYSLLSTCEWIHTRVGDKYAYWIRYMETAAYLDNLDIVIFIHNHGYVQCDTNAMDLAAGKGHLEIVKFLHENGSEGRTITAMDEAAKNGHLEVVQYLYEKRSEGCTTNAMDAAASNGYLDVVKCLHENRTEGCTTNAMDMAAKLGHLDVIKFLHSNLTEGCTRIAMDYAVCNGHLD